MCCQREAATPLYSGAQAADGYLWQGLERKAQFLWGASCGGALALKTLLRPAPASDERTPLLKMKLQSQTECSARLVVSELQAQPGSGPDVTAPPEMVAAVSSARRRSFSSRSFSSSLWCCLCRSSIFFWCVSSIAAKPRSHVACRMQKGLIDFSVSLH